MSAKKLKQKEIIFKDLVRQNTGSHMLDSGFGSGRHWQQPLPSDKLVWTLDKGVRRDGSKYEYFHCTIPLHVFLEQTLEIDQELTAKLRRLQEQDGSRDVLWSSGAAELLANDMGLIDYGVSDNSYNHDNDLSQNFQFAIIGTEENKDHYFDVEDDVYILLETHNGADIRGGYSDVVVCKLLNSSFFDLSCDIRVSEVWDSNGVILDEGRSGDSIGDIRTDRWEAGYSHNPTYIFSEDVEEVIGLSDDKTEMHVKLKNGFFCTVYAGHRSEFY